MTDSPISIVFVHGFLSGRHTWQQFAEVIASDEEFAEQVSIVPFEYDTRIVQLNPLRRIPSLPDAAELLRTTLRDRVTVRPVVLATHSMGGLIVQQYLADRLRSGNTDELADIAGVVMFACPTDGSPMLYRTRSMIPLRHRQERRLRPLNEATAANRAEVINRVVHSDDPTTRIPIWAYAGSTDAIVPPVSAKSVFPDRFYGSLPGDHFTIIRPDSHDHLSYLAVRRRVQEAIDDHRDRHQDTSVSQSATPRRWWSDSDVVVVPPGSGGAGGPNGGGGGGAGAGFFHPLIGWMPGQPGQPGGGPMGGGGGGAPGGGGGDGGGSQIPNHNRPEDNPDHETRGPDA
ncbi:esterase/lipase family protein [Nocardia nepalensis]|uniref:esterase/lipase family protein n=1 Tax=Nocardia nepalensis TaxID=3375448 RepID=UPI003B6814AE